MRRHTRASHAALLSPLRAAARYRASMSPRHDAFLHGQHACERRHTVQRARAKRKRCVRSAESDKICIVLRSGAAVTVFSL